jgi:hypothetical protein
MVGKIRECNKRRIHTRTCAIYTEEIAMILPRGTELTEHYCDMVVKLAQSKDIGNDRYYVLDSFTTRAKAEEAQKIVKGFGFNARIVNDYGIKVYIRKGLHKKQKRG